MITDDELADFLGIANAKGRAEILAGITPAKRAAFEKMRDEVRAIQPLRRRPRPAASRRNHLQKEKDTWKTHRRLSGS